MLPGYPESAICVQRFDDSLSSAIHITYRNWLRSSSMHEPRDPPLEVVIGLLFYFLLESKSRHSHRNNVVLIKVQRFVAQVRPIDRDRSFKTLRRNWLTLPHLLSTIHSGVVKRDTR